MYRKLIVSLIVSASLAPLAVSAQTAAPATAAAPASPHTVTGNLMLTSDYRFRGLSQTFKLPAVQGGIDYSHSSGFYLGTWASNVSGNQYPNGASMEWDFYGGFKFEPAKDWVIDLGVLHYYYPGAWITNNGVTHTGNTKFDNTEIYAALAYKWMSLKYSHTVTDLFGIRSEIFPPAVTGTPWCGIDSSGVAYTLANAPHGCFYGSGSSKGSGYTDFTVNYPASEKATVVFHVGHQSVKNYGDLSYTDWKLGINYDIGSGWILGAAYIDTNAKESFYRAVSGTPAGATSPDSVKDISSGTAVVSIGKSF